MSSNSKPNGMCGQATRCTSSSARSPATACRGKFTSAHRTTRKAGWPEPSRRRFGSRHRRNNPKHRNQNHRRPRSGDAIETRGILLRRENSGCRVNKSPEKSLDTGWLLRDKNHNSAATLNRFMKSIVVSKSLVVASGLFLSTAIPMFGQVLYYGDDFDAGTSGASWTALLSHADASANFAFDYS